MKLAVIPIVSDAVGMLRECLEKRLEELEIRGRIIVENG